MPSSYWVQFLLILGHISPMGWGLLRVARPVSSPLLKLTASGSCDCSSYFPFSWTLLIIGSYVILFFFNIMISYKLILNSSTRWPAIAVMPLCAPSHAILLVLKNTIVIPSVRFIVFMLKHKQTCISSQACIKKVLICLVIYACLFP